MAFQITGNELKIAVLIGLLGFFAYSPMVIRWLNTLSPWQGDIFYEILFYVILYFGARVGFFIYEPKKVPLKEALGLFLVTTALLMTINWESPYVNIITNGNADNLSQIYWQTDDGVSWWFTTKYIPNIDVNDCKINDYCQARIIAFAIIPFLIALSGFYLLTGRVPVNH